MNSDSVVETIEKVLLCRTLSPVERLILCESWAGQTYSEMAKNSGYGSIYLKEVGSQLWQSLSDALGERVTKKNLHLIFRQYSSPSAKLPSTSTSSQSSPPIFPQIPLNPTGAMAETPFPSGPVPLDSPLYIPRPPIETQCDREIQKPGCALRIKAPQKMGKSSLLTRILNRANTQGYRTVQIDFQEAEGAIFESLDRFLRWFSVNISRQLNLPPALDDYWDEEMGSKVSCKIYFEGYLLEQIEAPLVLALNELNRVFEYPAIARDFLPMLRFWYERAKVVQVWQKLRLILVHSTEIYVPLKLNQSPFNVGLAVVLPPFAREQVRDLARRCGLDWGSDRVSQLMAMVGGHPYLVSLALYVLAREEMTLEELLREAPKQSGIYRTHLRGLLGVLRGESELKASLGQVLATSESVELGAIAAYKLESMGLVQLEGNRARLSCELYRLYFTEQLPQLGTLEGESRATDNLDELTQLANRNSFDRYLEIHWPRGRQTVLPWSLILCDVDYFNFYVEARGVSAGNQALQRIADTLRHCIHQQMELRTAAIARYETARFAALLPHTTAQTAFELAKTLRQRIKALALIRESSPLNPSPSSTLTASLGVAAIQPSPETPPELLVVGAEEALIQAQRQGRDRVVCWQGRS
ncbi:MAG: AAA-like domain-containing protein [Cyanobacteriota bacterium]|nr:AAA-like domain-containing protein [Cyanobacteriota bacterium]